MNQVIHSFNANSLTMSSRDIAALVESRHADVCRTVERLMAKSVIKGSAPAAYTHEQNGQQYHEYHLCKRDSYVVVAQLSPEFTARLVDRWQELEATQAPKLPSTYLEALEALIESEKQKQIAIATKAEIGSRREATAMNTASIAVKRAAKLERDLDRSKDYCTIKRMTMLTHGQTFNWRLLKSASQDLGIPPIDVFDANYGTVKAYHADVWREAYGLEVAA